MEIDLRVVVNSDKLTDGQRAALRVLFDLGTAVHARMEKRDLKIVYGDLVEKKNEKEEKKTSKRSYSRKKPRGKVLSKAIAAYLNTEDRPKTLKEIAKNTKGHYATVCGHINKMRKAGIVDATSNHKKWLYFLRKPANNGKADKN